MLEQKNREYKVVMFEGKEEGVHTGLAFQPWYLLVAGMVFQ